MGNHSLTTEGINQNTIDIDHMTSTEMLTVMNQEDRKITEAISKVIPEIAKATDIIFNVIKNGGHVYFIGAGTSGRLGVLEAAECPPTFGVSDDMFQAIIAGGNGAIFKSVESAEDDLEQGRKDLEDKGLTEKDAVIGIAASGKTPYVIGALEWAKSQKAKTIAVTCNKDSLVGQIADVKIEVVPGPEVISGSTRMKAGSTQKIVLNMITTSAMIKMGKVYKNLMVDLNISNNKLKERAVNMLQTVTEVDEATALKALERSHFNVKTAIVMLKRNADYEEAKQLLEESNGYVREAIDQEDTRLFMKF